jgi:hypothetical protein
MGGCCTHQVAAVVTMFSVHQPASDLTGVLQCDKPLQREDIRSLSPEEAVRPETGCRDLPGRSGQVMTEPAKHKRPHGPRGPGTELRLCRRAGMANSGSRRSRWLSLCLTARVAVPVTVHSSAGAAERCNTADRTRTEGSAPKGSGHLVFPIRSFLWARTLLRF